MKRINHKEIAEFLKKFKKIAIFGHVSPDGDCYGACLGLKLGFEKLGGRGLIYLADTLPEFIKFLNEYTTFEKSIGFEPVDAVFILDTPSWQRIDNVQLLEQFKQSKTPIYVIDHHEVGDLLEKADYIWQDPSFSSASEMILKVLQNLKLKFDKTISTLLLTGIETDTSSFQNQNTTEESFKAAAFLVANGARLGTIINNAFLTKEIDVVKVYGLALERLIFNKEYQTVTSFITEKDLLDHNLGREAVSGIANYLNSIGGASIVFLIYADGNGKIEVSLRTRSELVDVQVLAKFLGGGGHKKASGFTTSGSFCLDQGKPSILA